MLCTNIVRITGRGDALLISWYWAFDASKLSTRSESRSCSEVLICLTFPGIFKYQTNTDHSSKRRVYTVRSSHIVSLESPLSGKWARKRRHWFFCQHRYGFAECSVTCIAMTAWSTMGNLDGTLQKKFIKFNSTGGFWWLVLPPKWNQKIWENMREPKVCYEHTFVYVYEPEYDCSRIDWGNRLPFRNVCRTSLAKSFGISARS